LPGSTKSPERLVSLTASPQHGSQGGNCTAVGSALTFCVEDEGAGACHRRSGSSFYQDRRLILLHKKNPVHKIAAPAWKLVYADFEKECRDECTVLDIQYDRDNYPTERNLQDNLRDYLSTLVTGTSDTPEGNVTPQNDENLNRIKQTDGHARRNMINLRERLINEADSVGDGVEEITSVQAKGERRTNIQKRAADSLDKMNSIIGESSGKITTLLQEQTNMAEKKLRMYAEKNSAQGGHFALKVLKNLLDEKVISKETYLEKAKEIYDKL
jgi:hypothetical protein